MSTTHKSKSEVQGAKAPSRLDLPEDKEERLQSFLDRTDAAIARRAPAQARCEEANADLLELGFCQEEIDECLHQMASDAIASGARTNAKAAEKAKVAAVSMESTLQPGEQWSEIEEPPQGEQKLVPEVAKPKAKGDALEARKTDAHGKRR